jgi:hypothetical protein
VKGYEFAEFHKYVYYHGNGISKSVQTELFQSQCCKMEYYSFLECSQYYLLFCIVFSHKLLLVYLESLK